MIIDGHRLTESERLKFLADEEHAALEAQFYEFYADDPYPPSLLASAIVPSSPATPYPYPDDDEPMDAMERYEAAFRVIHGVAEVPQFPALKRVG